MPNRPIHGLAKRLRGGASTRTAIRGEHRVLRLRGGLSDAGAEVKPDEFGLDVAPPVCQQPAIAC